MPTTLPVSFYGQFLVMNCIKEVRILCRGLSEYGKFNRTLKEIWCNKLGWEKRGCEGVFKGRGYLRKGYQKIQHFHNFQYLKLLKAEVGILF